MKILIIEDEPFSRAELIRLLKASGRPFEVLAEIDTVDDSISWLESHPAPALIFLDIQLADGLSFEIFKKVKVDSPVIFTTAYDEYALRAFQLNSIDYLLKPVRQEDLRHALDKLENMQRSIKTELPGIDMSKIESLLQMMGPAFKTRILLKVGDQLRSADIGEIAYFYAEEDVVFAMLKDRKRYIVDYTLGELDGQLDPKRFFRLTRGCIAQIDAVKKVSKYFNSRLAVELDPPMDDKLLVSRVNVPEFLKWLDR